MAVWAWDGSLVWTDGSFATSTLRRYRHTLDTGVPWVWIAAGAASSISYLSLCVLLLWTLRVRRPMRGRIIAPATLYSGHLVHAAQCAFCAAVGQVPMAVTAGAVAFFDLLWPAAFALREGWIRHVFGICGVGYALAIVHHYDWLVVEPARILGSTFGFINLYLWAGLPQVYTHTHLARRQPARLSQPACQGATIRHRLRACGCHAPSQMMRWSSPRRNRAALAGVAALTGLCTREKERKCCSCARRAQVGVALSAYWLRMRSRARAATAVVDDARRYQRLWEGLLLDEAKHSELNRLAAAAEALTARLPAEASLRQRLCGDRVRGGLVDFRALGGPARCGAEPWTRGSWRSRPAGPQGLPVESIEQLCAQAAVADLFLRQKVQIGSDSRIRGTSDDGPDSIRG